MFEALKALPADPILGLMAAYRQDNRSGKIDLGVGVYKDPQGNTPVMRAVKQAEKQLLESQQSKTYIGPAGSADFNEEMALLVLGSSLADQLRARRVTFQTPGGCGGLRLAAEFIKRAAPQARVLVSDPTWANHVPLLGDAGLRIERYPYYDHQAHRLRFDEMMTALGQAGPGDVVLLHGSCHNPCGADLDHAQWQAVADLALHNGFNVFIDMAYQGLGDGIDEDAWGVRLLAQTLPELIVVNSCSKNFGLYRERTGALTVIGTDSGTRDIASSQIAAIARGIYSMPPDHGAAVVQTILGSASLRQIWLDELAEIRQRINETRATLSRELSERSGRDFSFITTEKGMFSFLGISAAQVARLIESDSIYMVDSSRMNIAGINDSNREHFINAVANVLQD